MESGVGSWEQTLMWIGKVGCVFGSVDVCRFPRFEMIDLQESDGSVKLMSKVVFWYCARVVRTRAGGGSFTGLEV